MHWLNILPYFQMIFEHCTVDLLKFNHFRWNGTNWNIYTNICMLKYWNSFLAQKCIDMIYGFDCRRNTSWIFESTYAKISLWSDDKTSCYISIIWQAMMHRLDVNMKGGYICVCTQLYACINHIVLFEDVECCRVIWIKLYNDDN